MNDSLCDFFNIPKRSSDDQLIQSIYNFLGIELTSGNKEFSTAYRKKALELHPDRNRDNVAAANNNFRLLGLMKAFIETKFSAVLNHFDDSDNVKKAMDANKEPDDIFSELKDSGRSVFTHEAFRVFARMGQDPSTMEVERSRSMDVMEPDVVVTLPITLYELYEGCQRTVHYTRLTLEENCNGKLPVPVSRKVTIAAGQTNMKIVCLQQGHQNYNNWPESDLIVMLEVLPHPIFKREGNNLVTETQFKWEIGLKGIYYEFDDLVDYPDLFGEDKRVKDKIVVDLRKKTIKDDYIHKIKDKGFKKNKDGSRSGDMIVKIKIIKPSKMLGRDKLIADLFS